MNQGIITKVSGPLVVATGLPEAKMFDVVKVGTQGLVGEVIEIRGDKLSIQVYEETSGLGPGDPVVSTGEPLSVELGPGLLESIFDGIQRPLDVIEKKVGSFITRGVEAPALNREKKWKFVPRVKPGDRVVEGDVIGTVQETVIVEHRIMVPPGLSGVIEDIREGEFTVTEPVAVLKTESGQKVELTMMQKWPVRKTRPYKEKLPPDRPMATGQRVIDTLFPVAKGGTACIPGPFGSGKTVVQHQLAKWADAEIVVYIGCGERGNEMTDVLLEFPELKDPKSGEPLMKRTVLIANTSNMPVAAREASIYTGITIAEYFRDMGYSVALMADSTSRWAEALREIAGRLEEMPAEEGYPAYLASRLAQFYERAGYFENLNGSEGSITIIGAVSPAGGDFSEPVTQATKRVVGAFLALDKELAHARHFPAINWLLSYSGYVKMLGDWYAQNVAEDFLDLRSKMLSLLQEENKLMDVVKLVGEDVLPDDQRLILEIARVLKTAYLQQNAYHKEDSFVPLERQYTMLKIIEKLYDRAYSSIKNGIPLGKVKDEKLFNDIVMMKYNLNFDEIANAIDEHFDRLESMYKEGAQYES